ncbi:hypothetical protein Tco_1490368 [Tanacetum coccineum]
MERGIYIPCLGPVNIRMTYVDPVSLVWARDRPSSTKYANNNFGNPISEIATKGTVSVRADMEQKPCIRLIVCGTPNVRTCVAKEYRSKNFGKSGGIHVDQLQGNLKKVSAELRVGMQLAIDNFIGFFHAIDCKLCHRDTETLFGQLNPGYLCFSTAIPLTSYMVFLRQQLLIFNINPAAQEDMKYNKESRYPAHVEIRSPATTALAGYDSVNFNCYC